MNLMKNNIKTLKHPVQWTCKWYEEEDGEYLQDGVYETSSPAFPTSGPARGIRKNMEGNLQDGV